MGAEEGTGAGVLLQQTAQRDGFGLVTAGELAGGLLDQGDDAGALMVTTLGMAYRCHYIDNDVSSAEGHKPIRPS